MGVDTTDRQYWVPRLPKARERVDVWWPEGQVIGLCPYGASRKRSLSIGVIKTIIEQALDADKRWVLLIAHENDLAQLRQALAHEPWFGQILFRPTPDLFLLFEQVARCNAMISVDTAAVHIASGFDLPILGLYAPQRADDKNMLAWHPRAGKSVVLIARESNDGSMGDFNAGDLEKSVRKVISWSD